MVNHIQQDTIPQKATYKVAGLYLELVFPAILKRAEILPSFEPFFIEYDVTEKSICSIELTFQAPLTQNDGGKLLSDLSVVWGEKFRFYEGEDYYTTTIWNEFDDGLWKMKSSKDFSHSVIYLVNNGFSINNALSWLVMVAFGQACLLHHTILIHASVIAKSGEGYAFLGKSGTGKSTHSRLWLDHIQGAQLLNDDNPAVRLENDGQVYIYGTPWSGKTSCYKNIKVRLQAFVRLKQSSYNHLAEQRGTAAFVCLLPSCTAIRWNNRLFTAMSNTVEAILHRVIITELGCLPNRDAALLCYHEILKIDKQTVQNSGYQEVTGAN
ncbi:hypothetical protein [Pedobacter antarcticus]|uniref:hypothetical protein n=1 Tax=Pedobacter antarcticus TaxID=34086 RepID=UPI00292EB0B3|nr:hypothetical protein [Pedobacter antarcticus]